MTYRDGPVGALLDIYQSEINVLKDTLRENFDTLDGDLNGEDWNVKKIVTHVIYAGFGYTKGIRDQWGGVDIEHPEGYTIETIDQSLNYLDKIFDYMEKSLSDKIEFNEAFVKQPLTTRWGQSYDLEQIVEHAIVHIQRHHRQIKRYHLS